MKSIKPKQNSVKNENTEIQNSSQTKNNNPKEEKDKKIILQMTKHNIPILFM
jgi:hypothetical protein